MRSLGRRRTPIATIIALTAAALALALPGTTVAAGAAETIVGSPCSAADATHVVVSGDTWFDIARRSGLGLGALLSANAASESRVIHPGDVICLAGGAGGGGSGDGRGSPSDRYAVVSGDSWFDIARRAGVSTSALLAVNDSTERRILHPGDLLRLPAGADSSIIGRSGGTPSRGVNIQALPLHGPCWYADSWHAPRGAGRLHLGVDLFAQSGNYVYAVADGTLSGRIWDGAGVRSGNAWWLTAADGTGTRYFYSHLADFAPGLQVGSRVAAGQIIGFMGNTGNSSFPHLHFEIRPGGGDAINPYPLLRQLGGCKSGDGYRQPNGWTPDSSGYRP